MLGVFFLLFYFLVLFSEFEIAVGKTIHMELARSGSTVRRQEDTMTSDKYNNHQITLVKCSAVPKCGCLQSVPMMLAEETCCLGQQEAPAKARQQESAST